MLRDSEMRRELAGASLGELEVTGSGRGRRRFRFTADFPGFSGHFPGHPVLPAMLQILLGIMVCEDLAGSALVLTGVERAKFVSQVQPFQEITVSCRLKSGKESVSARVDLEVKGGRAASMRLLLEPQPTDF